MPTRKAPLHCGPVRGQPGGPVEKIVVFGGSKGKARAYNVQGDFWESDVDHPNVSFYGAGIVPFKDTFLVIGGSVNGNCSDILWKYEKSGGLELLEELPFKLSEGKRGMTAIAVPSDIFPGC